MQKNYASLQLSIKITSKYFCFNDYDEFHPIAVFRIWYSGEQNTKLLQVWAEALATGRGCRGNVISCGSSNRDQLHLALLMFIPADLLYC